MQIAISRWNCDARMLGLPVLAKLRSGEPLTAKDKLVHEQARAVRAALQSRGRPATAEELACTFTRAPVDKVADLLETLATLGQARAAGEGRFVA